MSGIEIEEVDEASGERVGAASGNGAGTTRERAARHHDSGLLAIGLLKLAEAVFFFLVGVGAIHFIHRDLGDAALRLAERLRIDPDGRLVSWMLDHLDAHHGAPAEADRRRHVLLCGAANDRRDRAGAGEGVGGVPDRRSDHGLSAVGGLRDCAASGLGAGLPAAGRTLLCWLIWCGGWGGIRRVESDAGE